MIISIVIVALLVGGVLWFFLGLTQVEKMSSASIIKKIGVGMLVHSVILLAVFLFLGVCRRGSYKVDPQVLFWLIYLAASIGLLRDRAWGRILGIYTTAIAAIFYFGLWLYLTIEKLIMSSGSQILGFNFLWSFVFGIIPVCLPSLIFLVLLMHPKVKDGFKK